MARDSSEADAGPVFNEEEFVLRHKTEAQNMFGLMDHLLGRKDHYAKALDMGGGYGDHLPFILDRIGSVISVDILNYFDESVFSPREVANRSQRYGGSMPLDRVAFHHCDAQNLIYRESLFDLVFSINAFEHIPNPVLALGEALRVTRVGAPIYIQFDPIWNSPSGHHLPHLNFEPWQHLLVDEAEFSRLILSKGGTEKDVHVFSTAMNRRSFSYYERMFREDFSERFLSPTLSTWCRDAKDEPASQHPNFQRCLSRGYRVEELITRGVQFFGVKAW